MPISENDGRERLYARDRRDRLLGAITLVGGDLRALPRALAFSRAMMRVIRQDLFWAFAYNVVYPSQLF